MVRLIDYSPAGEPQIFRQFIDPLSPRSLIDVDAGDGITASLSRELIDEGWSAILIESDPVLFHELETNCKGLASVQCLNAVLSNRDGTRLVENVTADSLSSSARLSSVLARLRVPNDMGLLLLNNAGSAIEVLEGMDAASFRPRLIVTRDHGASANSRSKKYSLLSNYGYWYSGLAAEYSIWTLSQRRPDNCQSPQVSRAGMPDLPGRATGSAAFDKPKRWGTVDSDGLASFAISGWAFSELQSVPPPLVYLEVSGQDAVKYFQAHRYCRADVSEHFKAPNLLMSGFRALIPLSERTIETVTVRVLQADAQTYYNAAPGLLLKRELQEYESTARDGLARRFLGGSGIEIGALQRPLRVPENCGVRYVDRMPLDELLRHYPELGGMPIQAPDLIDDGEKLSRIADRTQDFVIANHFLEHCENPIQTLSNLLRVVKLRGILFVAVPDKRFTFDFYRPVTSYSALKQTYLDGRRHNRQSLYEEWVRFIEHGNEATVKTRAAELMAANYSIHFNVWTLDDLLQFVLQARSDFELPLHISSLVCCDNEAILVLERTGAQTVSASDGAGEDDSNRSYTSKEEANFTRTTKEASASCIPPYPEVEKGIIFDMPTPVATATTAISSISPVDSTRIYPQYPKWNHIVPLPPASLMFSVGAAAPETFLVLADAWGQLASYCIPQDATVLEIGCGCGRAARILINNKWIRKYIGFDVIRENVDWCRNYIEPAWPGVAEFHWFDLYSHEYNPGGALRAQELAFPCSDGEADLIFAASVFTHLLEQDAVHYLVEIHRALSARGTALLSIHIEPPAGERFYGNEARIDMDPNYFLELASKVGLSPKERVGDIGGQEVFAFQRA